ncbi:MAG: PhaM family polyhydroxyalkanoate granule multifunctional regulatory protein [Burkholderiaceae bacterium]|jgi:hypothetical protein
MSTDRSTSPFAPGFDFLKSLTDQAGKGLEGLQQMNPWGAAMTGGLNSGIAGLKGMNRFQQWVAPTLDPDELDKRIEELRTVQFWLEQNAKLLGATIQALEVQRMTLSTLRSMDVPLPDLQAVLGAMMPASPAQQAPAKAPAPKAAGPNSERAAGKARRSSSRPREAPSGKQDAATGTAAPVDPMKWWGALTEQFQQLAAQALAGDGSKAEKAAPKAPDPRAAKPSRPRSR